MKASKVRNWKSRRQYNHVLGIGVDAPVAQPQTNAYDVHNVQQGGEPWESPYSDSYLYVCYRYGYSLAEIVT